MRYFTTAWWCGRREDDDCDPVGEYARHLATIRHLLPADLLAIQESISLHDARLRELLVLPTDHTARLVLDSHTGDERFTLTYTEVERVESTADPAVGLPGPHGYGDFGYDEVAVFPAGAIEHRMLFSSGIELCIVFGGFTVLREARS